MLKNLITNSKLDWISTDILPNKISVQEHKSVEVIMLFSDGFVTRGHYNYNTESWCGYNTLMVLESYNMVPDFYIIL